LPLPPTGAAEGGGGSLSVFLLFPSYFLFSFFFLGGILAYSRNEILADFRQKVRQTQTKSASDIQALFTPRLI
jgi:hypothetical protein